MLGIGEIARVGGPWSTGDCSIQLFFNSAILRHFQRGAGAASPLWSIHGAASISKDCAGGGHQNEWLGKRAGGLRSDVVSSDRVMEAREHSQVINTLGRENVFGHNPVIGASTDMRSMPRLSCYMVVTRCPRTAAAVLRRRGGMAVWTDRPISVS